MKTAKNREEENCLLCGMKAKVTSLYRTTPFNVNRYKCNQKMVSKFCFSKLQTIVCGKLRRSGFHFYAIAQLLMLVLPLLFMGKGFLGLGDVMFTALFLLIYYLQLKSLGAFDGDNTADPPAVAPEE